MILKPGNHSRSMVWKLRPTEYSRKEAEHTAGRQLRNCVVMYEDVQDGAMAAMLGGEWQILVWTDAVER